MYQEMTIFGFALDGLAQMPVIILKDAAGETSVPIWISVKESLALAVELTARDNSPDNGRKDLLSVLMQRVGMRIDTIAIDSLNDGVFNASIRFTGGGEDLVMEVRVSEAIITALKYKLPVMVNKEVVEQATHIDLKEGCFSEESDPRRFVDFLENLDPAAMGKYPM